MNRNNSSSNHSSSYCNCSKNSIPGDAATKLEGVFVKEPLETDVLFGKGKQPLEHPGNKRMRHIVDKYTILYHSQLKAGKKEIAQQVYGEVMQGGTRFLKRVDRPHHGWIVVDNITAMSKIGHALRCKKNASRLLSKSQDLAKRFHPPLMEATIPQSSRFSIESNASILANPPTSVVFSRHSVDQRLYEGGLSLVSSNPAVAAAQVVCARERADLERTLELSRFGLGILSSPSSITIGTQQSRHEDLLLRREMENIAALRLLSKHPLNRFPSF